MDRRYICTRCGVKWFIPASQPRRPELTVCPECGAPVEVLSEPGRATRPMTVPRHRNLGSARGV